MPWTQLYDPLDNALLSTAMAALPVVVLLGLLAFAGWSAPRAAAAGLVTALAVALFGYGMPASAAFASAAYGACFGLFPIGWIVLNAIFLYTLTVQSGQFEIVKHSVASLSADRRIQAMLIAFSFGAFIEGAAGFGTPVAISAALLDRPWLPATLRRGPGADREHRARRLRRARHPDHHARQSHRPRRDEAQRDGRAAVADLFADRSRLDGVDNVRLARPARRLAGGPRQRRQFRASCSSSSRTISGRHWSMSPAASYRSFCLALFMRVWKPRESWEFDATQKAASPGRYCR